MDKFITDGIENIKQGLGLVRDPKKESEFSEIELDRDEIERAYRYDWTFAKAVDIPATDATRKFLKLSGDIAKEYKRLRVKWIVRKALEYKALYGVGYIIIESEKKSLKSSLKVGDSIKQLHVYHKYDFDIEDKDVHSSRIYELRENDFGDSLLYRVKGHILNLITSLDIPASLLHRADTDFLSINGLAEMLRKCKQNKDCREVEEKIIKRVQLFYEQISIFKIGIKDSEEELENFSKNLSGYDKLQTVYMYVVAGACDIPATRFFGMSPSGMNATGEIELNMYYDRLSSMQDEYIDPFLEKINEVMGFDEPIEFLPIKDQSPRELLELEEKKANIISKFIDELDPETIAKAVAKLSVFEGIEVIPNVQEE